MLAHLVDLGHVANDDDRPAPIAYCVAHLASHEEEETTDYTEFTDLRTLSTICEICVICGLPLLLLGEKAAQAFALVGQDDYVPLAQAAEHLAELLVAQAGLDDDFFNRAVGAADEDERLARVAV